VSEQSARRRLILLAPIGPAPGGNGLAMRCELFRRAAARDFEVQTVVVPVAGPAGASGAVEVANDGERSREGLRSLLAAPQWRERLARAGSLPQAARAASPGLAGTVVQALGARRFDALHVMRAYLAPLGVALADHLGVEARTLDLDDDDVAVLGAHRNRAEAAAYERLIDVFGGLYDGQCAASALDASAIAARHELAVEHVPNAVALPAGTPSPAPRAAELRLLFVGNLTYPPNVEAARLLVGDVLPRLRAMLGERPLRVTLAGSAHPDVERLASPNVRVLGFVDDLDPLYADADVVLVPLQSGGGTRIKLLEAFAQGVPVVATPAAAQGLAVEDRRHLLLAADPQGLATAVAALAADPGLARLLVEQSGRLVRERYSHDAVIPLVRAFLSGATRAPRSPQPSVSS
jgi:glycosyltransferase involved in cell wall biosynthesis